MQSNVPFAFCEFEIRFILLVSLSLSHGKLLDIYLRTKHIKASSNCSPHSALCTCLCGEGCSRGLTRVITDGTWQSEPNRVRVPNASGPARQEERVTVISPVAIWTFELGTRNSLAARQRIWHSTLARFL